MLSLDELDARIRAALMIDARVSHALAYGSRTQHLDGEWQGDAYSDLEYYAYLRPGAVISPRAFLETLTPLLLYVVNLFGTPNAVTPELHRIELHVVDAAQMSDILAWPLTHADVAAMLIKDEGGQLARTLGKWAAGPDWTPQEPQLIYDQALNWLTFASAVAARGELLRAAELLTWVRAALLRLARFALGLVHLRAETRRAERDLGGWARRIADVGSGAGEGLRRALELCRELAAALGLEPRGGLLAALEARAC
ncbi:hypothetical protein GCM10022631_15480 [Deinococcus rubellus]|uniref:Nucleotidyltransferase domain-containing protein n=1 Tax=Deinococcus rubellus TaxID=1889240 RepID=A0ABY5YL80_9DEIO|nr:hypothetical protein [Deinococcus rubellus]UWX64857.1 hypothetical protein N0D28_04130 [Deinococcus rubellus]